VIDKSLYQWCAKIRSARKGKHGLILTADRIAALDAIGFDWRSEGISFINRLDQLRAYRAQYGHSNVKLTKDKSLYHWCANKRFARKNP
jgi:hypothetical protein